MEDRPPLRITAPRMDLESLSFCDGDPDSVREWARKLPLADTAEAATRIRQATFEIARYQTGYQHRMTLLEVLRPTLHELCARLDSSAASGHSDIIARLAQRMQTSLYSGYKSTILAALDDVPSDAAAAVAAQAILRALTDLSKTLLRTLQFYIAPADQLWLELNQLYRLAEQLGLCNISTPTGEGSAGQSGTITDSYLRSVLLATSKPNQLRYQQLTAIYDALPRWTPDVSIRRDATETLFVVDLASDHAPGYSRLITDAQDPRGIDTRRLVATLERELRDGDQRAGPPASQAQHDELMKGLMAHVIGAWGAMRRRSFRRVATSGTMKVSIGFRPTHYFLSGGIDFVDHLDDADALIRSEINPYLERRTDLITVESHDDGAGKDLWKELYLIPLNPQIQDPNRILVEGARKSRAQSRQQEWEDLHEGRGLRFYDTTAVDISAGGYRIRWNEPLPSNVQAGELVGIRGETDPHWCIAIIRWIRQEQSGTSMGIELTAPRAIPVAVRVVKARGGPGEFARAFLLPALNAINQSATLVAPAVSFHVGQKIHIRRQGLQTTAHLSRCTLKTESVKQFTFRVLDGYLEIDRLDINIDGSSESDGLRSGGS